MLTVEQVTSDLEKEGYLIAYTHFTHDVEPPFLIIPGVTTENEFADNRVYESTEVFSLEFYCCEDLRQSCSKLEKTFDRLGYAWEKEYQVWIDEEKMLDTRYSLA